MIILSLAPSLLPPATTTPRKAQGTDIEVGGNHSLVARKFEGPGKIALIDSTLYDQKAVEHQQNVKSQSWSTKGGYGPPGPPGPP